jgi:nicotinamide riboside kinase
MGLEDKHAALAAQGSGLVIQDTDLLSTVVYCDHYFGACPPWIADTARERRPDLYLLLSIDVPWIADGIRDRGHMREEMHELFRNAVVGSGAPYEIIEGSWDERWKQAIEAVDELLSRRLH